eukprot:632683-Pleurochrysis_carterae.AAC.1
MYSARGYLQPVPFSSSASHTAFSLACPVDVKCSVRLSQIPAASTQLLHRPQPASGQVPRANGAKPAIGRMHAPTHARPHTRPHACAQTRPHACARTP